MKNLTKTNFVLKDLYRNLKSVSNLLIDNFSDENVMLIIDKRTEIINKINSCNTGLSEKTIKESLDNETMMIIADIVKSDKTIASKISSRMHEITGEIRGLYKKSHATAAYINYKK